MISGSEEKEFYYNDQSIAFVSLFCDLPLSLSAKLEIAKSVYLDFGFEACLYEKKDVAVLAHPLFRIMAVLMYNEH